MEGVGSLGRRGRRCQSSSVTNGMKGCRRRRPWSRQVYNVCCADLRVVSDADSSDMGFMASYEDMNNNRRRQVLRGIICAQGYIGRTM